MIFEDILTNDDLLDALYDMHFVECTPIQEKVIPKIIEGKDIVGIAQTGTGKTAAYLLPVIEKLINDNFTQDNINCVIMVPTRELAQQIDRQMQGFSYYLPINSIAIYGGTDGNTFDRQKNGLKKGTDVVIATPGRLLSHINMGYVNLSKVSFFILDEADRMLDMGFSDDILQIVNKLPKNRQTLLFSATMPQKVKKIASALLTDPYEIKLAVSKTPDKIVQEAVVCYEQQKLLILSHLLRERKPNKIVVFASSKLKVKEVSRQLRLLNLNVAEMHSDLDQAERDNVMNKFKGGRINIIVATDIISRGIDIDNIETVINIDVPKEPEDYIHRIGRTARADREGDALTFISEMDCSRFRKIEKMLGYEIKKLEIPDYFGPTPEYLDQKQHLSRSISKSSTNKNSKRIFRHSNKRTKKQSERNS